MPAIDRAGIFKGDITDFAVSTTSKQKLPQLVVTLRATEIYDPDDETWEPWVQYDQVTTAYLVLVSLDGAGVPVKCFSYDAVMEAVDWDGETFTSLAAMNLKGKTVQFTVIEDEFQGTKRLKANSIAAEDASIGLKKLDAADLAALDATFRIASGKKPKAAKPKKAPKAKKAPAAVPPKAGPPPTSPPQGATPTLPAPMQVEACTEEEAWTACSEANEALSVSVPVEILEDYWKQAVLDTKVVADSENITPAEYGAVKNAVLISLGCRVAAMTPDNIPF